MMTTALDAAICPLCGDRRSEPVVNLSVHGVHDPSLTRLVRCVGCSLVRAEPALGRVPTAYASEEAFRAAHFPPPADLTDRLLFTAEAVESFVKGPGRFLDVGCGIGRQALAMQGRGWQVYGVEGDGFAARFARDHFGLPVETVNLDDYQPPRRSFEAIALTHKLQMCQQPGDVVRRLAEALVPGGVLWVTVPELDVTTLGATLRAGERPPALVPANRLYFDEATLRKALERAGLTVELIGPTTMQSRNDTLAAAGRKPTRASLTRSPLKPPVSSRLLWQVRSRLRGIMPKPGHERKLLK